MVLFVSIIFVKLFNVAVVAISALNSEVGPPREKIVIPAMAQKAGGSWRHEFRQVEGLNKTELTTGNRDEEDAENDWYEEDEEPECGPDMFYHIRGKKCVPMECPGGNTRRNSDTGDCTLKEYVRNRSWSRRRGYIGRSSI